MMTLHRFNLFIICGLPFLFGDSGVFSQYLLCILEFRISLLLDYMPPKAKEPCLPCYLTYSWWVRKKRWIHAFPEDICMNVWKWMQQTWNYFCFCISILIKVPNTQRLVESFSFILISFFSFILFSFLIRIQHICLYCIFIYKVNMSRHFPLVAYWGIAYNTTAFSLLFLIFCILLQDKILCTLCFLLWTIIGFCDWQKPELKTTLWPYETQSLRVRKMLLSFNGYQYKSICWLTECITPTFLWNQMIHKRFTVIKYINISTIIYYHNF